MANNTKYIITLLLLTFTLSAKSETLSFGEKVPKICWVNIDKLEKVQVNDKRKIISASYHYEKNNEVKVISCNFERKVVKQKG